MSKRMVKRTMTIILSCIGALLIMAFASLFIISGIFESPKYLDPWQKTYSQKFDDPRIRLMAHGLLAANGHNMQPAHRLDFVMQPLSQVLEEYPEMKEPYSSIHRDYASGGGTIQMLVRLGKPTKEVPQSMRRDVMDLIVGE